MLKGFRRLACTGQDHFQHPSRKHSIPKTLTYQEYDSGNAILENFSSNSSDISQKEVREKYMFKSKKKKKYFLQEALDLQRGSTSWQGNSFPIITIHKPLEKLEPTSPQQRSSYFAEDSTHSEQSGLQKVSQGFSTNADSSLSIKKKAHKQCLVTLQALAGCRKNP